MRAALLVGGLIAVLAACGPKVKNQCPGNVTGTCVAGEQCTFDQKRGCQVCQCAPLDNAAQDDPLGNDRNPDDRSMPPKPVH
ncbi:MAG: hypothetical protein ACKV2T_14035 [Kofleriaceae bacterium]